jgi:hypothetical protein
MVVFSSVASLSGWKGATIIVLLRQGVHAVGDLAEADRSAM